MKALVVAALMVCLGLAAAPARADAVQALREFVREVKTGRAEFTQVVTTPDGARRKLSSGRFEFARPDRFRFDYAKPYAQHIVADGKKVWVHDPDLNQVSSHKMAQALGSTPAALLAGAELDSAFQLTALPARDGLEWAGATPKVDGSGFQSMAVGFDGKTLAAVEIVDTFGQRSVLRFTAFQANPVLTAERFRFTPPAGADLLEQ